jgi:AcrR family transcriptional regulator
MSGSAGTTEQQVADPSVAPAGRGQAREQAICSAVMDLLCEMPYDGITVDAIAARAKSSKATIYRRWSNKDELVVDVLHREFLADGVQPEDTGSLGGDLLATLLRDIGRPEAAAHKAAAIRSLSTAITVAPELVATVMGELSRTQERLWEVLLDRAVARGEIASKPDPKLGVEVIRAQLCARTLFEGDDLGPEYLHHLVWDIVMPVVMAAASKQ